MRISTKIFSPELDAARAAAPKGSPAGKNAIANWWVQAYNGHGFSGATGINDSRLPPGSDAVKAFNAAILEKDQHWLSSVSALTKPATAKPTPADGSFLIQLVLPSNPPGPNYGMKVWICDAAGKQVATATRVGGQLKLNP